VAKAEEERKNAAEAAERSRNELTLAVATRRAEEARRQEEMRGRRDEEEKLKQAESARAAEETRLAQARAERARIENERDKLERERAQLEAARDALAAEVKRLAQASPPAKPAATAAAPVALPVPTPAKPVPKEEKAIVASVPAAPDSAKPVARPRSITLRVPSRVRRIDFVDEPTRSSVIIDLEEPSAFSVERSANRRVSLRLDHADLPDELVRSLDATEYLGPVRLISSYQDPHARGTVRVDVDLAEDVPNRVRQDGNRIYWDFQKAAPASGQKLPALGGPLPPSVLFVPARRVAGFSVTFDTLTLAQAQPQAQSPARKAGEDESPTAKRANLTGRKRYTGRRIDLDFKGADIHNILRLLADVGQMNIVTSDEVKGEVTIKMRDVPWDQALDVVLRAKGLGSVREGNLVRVAPLSVLEKELEQEIARQKQIAEVLPTETRLIGVSYAHASSLQDKARDLLSPRGKISVDDRTNNLIVSDVARNLQLIEDLVRNLDTQTSQVVIEARIVEANTDYARQIGIQWGGNTFMDTSHGNPTGLVFPYNVGIGGGADDGSSPLSGLVPGVRSGVAGGANPNFVVNMPAPAGLATGSAIGLTMGSVAGAFNLNLRLSAMESTGTVRILSSPRITTMDNIDATIEQGVSIPVSVVSAMGAMTQFVDAKLHLGVKPHVTNEGTVMLTVTVTKNEPDFVNTGARGDPTILKKEAKTTMLVRDGDTAVIGGIYTRNSGLSFTKVPFFSDIPVLGWFFRNRKENDNRTEFLVFLTPRIVNRARALGQ
jgi:type IV pilus assembly protein PilQ